MVSHMCGSFLFIFLFHGRRAYRLQNGFFQSPWRICYLLHYRRGLSLDYLFLILSVGFFGRVVISHYFCLVLASWSCPSASVPLVAGMGFSGGGCLSARSRGSWCPCVPSLPPSLAFEFIHLSIAFCAVFVLCCPRCTLSFQYYVMCPLSLFFLIFSPCQFICLPDLIHIMDYAVFSSV